MSSPRTEGVLEIVLPAIFAAAFIAAYAAAGKGAPLTYANFQLSMAAALGLYLAVSRRRPAPAPERLASLYLFAVALQLLHFVEEYLSGFYLRFPAEIRHAPPASASDFVLSQGLLFFLLVLAGIGVVMRWRASLVMVWFLVVMLEFVNAIQHPVFAMMTGGYFPGLYTALPGWVLGPALLARLAGKRRAAPSRPKAAPAGGMISFPIGEEEDFRPSR